MAVENGKLDESLSALLGNDAAIIAELRAAFLESANRQLDLLKRSRCDGNWMVAAMRLKGLAASFDVAPLTIVAQGAIDAAPGDPAAIRAVDAVLTQIAGGGASPQNG